MVREGIFLRRISNHSVIFLDTFISISRKSETSILLDLGAKLR